jgi:type IV pilus assembly protein PilA
VLIVNRRSTRTQHRPQRRQAGGFTLVELMIVVSIVGILSVLAVVSYRRLTNSSKSTEASQTIQGIRVAQEQYRAETGRYANLGTSLCPHTGIATAVGTTTKRFWNPDCNGGTATWRTLPMQTNTQVQFGYYTVAGRAGSTPPASGVTPAGAATVDWFYVYAQGDLNADGAGGLFTEVRGSSFTNDLQMFNEGE